MEFSTKIIDFMTPWAGVHVLGCCYFGYIVNNYYFF